MKPCCPDLELLAESPVQYAPRTGFVDLYELVPWLVENFPQWTLDDFEEFLEEKTRRRVHPEDLVTIGAIYLRHHTTR